MGYDRTPQTISDEYLSDATMKYLFELSLDLLCIAGFDGYFKLLNPAWETALGYSVEALLSKPFIEFIHPDDRAATNEATSFIAEGNELHHFENRYQTKGGSYRWFAWTASVQVSQERIYAIARDVTELKERKQQHLLQVAALEAADNAIVITDQKGNINWVNPAFSRLTGYSAEEAIGQNTRLLKSGKQDSVYYQELWESVAAGKVWLGELINRRKDGSTYVEQMTITPVKNESGETTHFIAIKQDITDNVEAVKKLQQAHEETENLLSSISSILIGIDRHDSITRWNVAAERVFGIPAEDVVGKPFVNATIKWDWAEVLRYIALSHGPDGLTEWDDLRYTNKDGKEGLLSITVTPILHNQVEFSGFLLLAQEITERRQLEMQLGQAQKLQSVGQLAAGIAHEINTPIQFVSDNVHFLRDGFKALIEQFETALDPTIIQKENVTGQSFYLESGQEAESQRDFLMQEIPEAIEASLEGIGRISKIVDAVRDFSHPGSEEKSLMDINAALEKTIIVSRNRWKYVADVTTDFDPGLPQILCLPGELNQVFLNIIVNAADAISDALEKNSDNQGTIAISTRLIGNYIRIDFRDTGPGISKDIQGEIFNPFFTTKEIGKGTGQGLAISHNVVVEKHGGSISFESEAGQGTLFIIKLPLQSEDATHNTQADIRNGNVSANQKI